ncbi:MAG TPA: DUF2723 domain-containing protein, partial [Gemmatimonadales bacterium]|nr:DUF2723 domain-containing protein [Gemmatimonadales bacterium]
MGSDVSGSIESPPYRTAALVSALVLFGYLLTLAPSVTWWDAGEFIAAARTLGIPHPPGTPLYVMAAHVWGALVPIGEYAARLNFLSALFSALAAGGFFLVAHEGLRAGEAFKDLPFIRVGGAAAAAIAGAFTFTQWQNSNETEVYAVAVFTIALMSWLALVWRQARRHGEPAARWLLLILYLLGLSIGCHLLALLAGPAVIAFLMATLRAEPADSEEVRLGEWGVLALLGAIWLLLVGVGLGSQLLLSLGGIAVAVALVFAFRARVASFGMIGLLLAAIG